MAQSTEVVVIDVPPHGHALFECAECGKFQEAIPLDIFCPLKKGMVLKVTVEVLEEGE